LTFYMLKIMNFIPAVICRWNSFCVCYERLFMISRRTLSLLGSGKYLHEFLVKNTCVASDLMQTFAFILNIFLGYLCIMIDPFKITFKIIKKTYSTKRISNYQLV
jgi:hypothetical protein